MRYVIFESAIIMTKDNKNCWSRSNIAFADVFEGSLYFDIFLHGFWAKPSPSLSNQTIPSETLFLTNCFWSCMSPSFSIFANLMVIQDVWSLRGLADSCLLALTPLPSTKLMRNITLRRHTYTLEINIVFDPLKLPSST